MIADFEHVAESPLDAPSISSKTLEAYSLLETPGLPVLFALMNQDDRIGSVYVFLAKIVGHIQRGFQSLVYYR